MFDTLYHSTGKYCLLERDGQLLYELIYPKLKENKCAVINFEKTRYYAATFFNYAIGQLLKDFSREKINELLILQNLSAHGKMIVEKVINNAEKFYNQNLK